VEFWQISEKLTAFINLGVEAAVCSEVGDEATACFRAEIEDGKWRVVSEATEG
jgi:hypothetical protein